MNTGFYKYPYPVRLAVVLLCLILIVFICDQLQVVIVPLIFSLIFSVMIYPLAKLLQRWKLSKGLAALFSVVIASVAIGSIIYFLWAQISQLSEQMPQLADKLDTLYKEFQTHLYHKYGIAKSDQTYQIKNQLNHLANDNGGKILGWAFKEIANFITDVTLIPLFVFFLLYFRDFFLEFFCKAFSTADNEVINTILTRMCEVIQSWLVGLVAVMIIVGTLNTIGLVSLGIQYAALFGFLAALLLLIPYVGIIIGSLLPALMALATKDSYWYAIGAMAVFLFVQILEGNLITPYVIGSKISINPLVAILSLILFGNLWGISGLILALPITAMCKVIFDAVPEMKPFGFVLGEPEKHFLNEADLPIPINKPLTKSRIKSQSHKAKDAEAA
jgi:predicted PurR-regulated permease PerM